MPDHPAPFCTFSGAVWEWPCCGVGAAGARRRRAGRHTRGDATSGQRPGVCVVPAVTGTREKSGWVRRGGPGEEAEGAGASWTTHQECAGARGEAATAGWRERPAQSSALGTAYQWAASAEWPGGYPRVSTSSKKGEGLKKNPEC